MRLPTQERWFLRPLILRLVVWLLFAHVYDIAVFQDVSWRMVTGQGIYEKFSGWLAAYGDGYYAYPPAYAYMLGASGWLADALGGHWWLYQILIKSWMLLADLVAVAFLYRLKPEAARAYWTLWVMPIVAIAQVQPDLWVGLSVLLAYYFARRDQWYATGLALAVGISMKMTPLVILPYLLYHLIRERKWIAGPQLVAALLMGLCMFWLPYAMIFDDERSFIQVLLFHLNRPASGLNVLVGVRSLLDTVLTGAMLVGQQVSAGAAISQALQQVTGVYPLLTVLAFLALARATRVQRWSLHLVFSLPLLVFLAANKVVHEQHLLHVLPLMLVISPDIFRQLGASYSAYVLAAGTPLRFFPQEYGLPLTPDALIPASHHAVLGPLITLGFAAVAGAAALVFSYQLYRLIRNLLRMEPLGVRGQVHSRPEMPRAWEGAVSS
jgi:hypothetical protein